VTYCTSDPRADELLLQLHVHGPKSSRRVNSVVDVESGCKALRQKGTGSNGTNGRPISRSITLNMLAL
jgi:hypothetical protein